MKDVVAPSLWLVVKREEFESEVVAEFVSEDEAIDHAKYLAGLTADVAFAVFRGTNVFVGSATINVNQFAYEVSNEDSIKS